MRSVEKLSLVYLQVILNSIQIIFKNTSLKAALVFIFIVTKDQMCNVKGESHIDKFTETDKKGWRKEGGKKWLKEIAHDIH